MIWRQAGGPPTICAREMTSRRSYLCYVLVIFRNKGAQKICASEHGMCASALSCKIISGQEVTEASGYLVLHDCGRLIVGENPIHCKLLQQIDAPAYG